MGNSNVPGSNQNVNVQVRALTVDPNVTVQYKTKILQKNVVNGVNTLTQEMMSAENIKYVIKYDYVLGENITVPDNCILEFDGGSVSNGTIALAGTAIIANRTVFKSGTDLTGTLIGNIEVHWFEDMENLSTSAKALNCPIHIYGDITINKPIRTFQGMQIFGDSEGSILRLNSNFDGEIKALFICENSEEFTSYDLEFSDIAVFDAEYAIYAQKTLYRCTFQNILVRTKSFINSVNCGWGPVYFTNVRFDSWESDGIALKLTGGYINEVVFTNCYFRGYYNKLIDVTPATEFHNVYFVGCIFEVLYCSSGIVFDLDATNMQNIGDLGNIVFSNCYYEEVRKINDHASDGAIMLNIKARTVNNVVLQKNRFLPTPNSSNAVPPLIQFNTLSEVGGPVMEGWNISENIGYNCQIHIKGTVPLQINNLLYNNSGRIKLYVNNIETDIATIFSDNLRVRNISNLNEIPDSTGTDKYIAGLNKGDIYSLNGATEKALLRYYPTSDIAGDFYKVRLYSKKLVSYGDVSVLATLTNIKTTDAGATYCLINLNGRNYLVYYDGTIWRHAFDNSAVFDGTTPIRKIGGTLALPSVSIVEDGASFYDECTNKLCIANAKAWITANGDVNYANAGLTESRPNMSILKPAFNSNGFSYFDTDLGIKIYNKEVYTQVLNITYTPASGVNSHFATNNLIEGKFYKCLVKQYRTEMSALPHIYYSTTNDDTGKVIEIPLKVSLLAVVSANPDANKSCSYFEAYFTAINPVQGSDNYQYIKFEGQAWYVNHVVTISEVDYKWIEGDGVVAGTKRNGTFANKPTVDTNNIPVGFKYFCTDKQTIEGATNGIEIIHKGNDVWVDALGRVVS